MKKMLLFFVALFVLTLAVSAEAQYYSDPRIDQIRGAIAGGGYRTGGGYYGGYYDPAYLQQMMSLPESLAACSVDFSTGKPVSCRPIAKNIQAINSFGQNNDRNELLGTVHAEKGKLHFRPFDDTNRRTGPVEGALGLGLLSAGATHVATSRMDNRGAANAITVGVGAGVGLLSWFKNHHNRHDNCLIIEPTAAQSGNLSLTPTAPTAQNIEQSAPVIVPVPVTPAVADKKIFRNRFEEAPVRVFDGSKKIIELSAGEEGTVELTSSSRIWGEARLTNPANGKLEWTPLQVGKGIDELPENAGWLFGNPKSRPSIDINQ